jgi:hypothetical protein
MAGVTVACPPTQARTHPSTPTALVRQLTARASDPTTYAAWAGQVHAAGYCQHPVRLAGVVEQVDQASGELRHVFTSEDKPDGVILVACGNRRATRCEPCSAVYRADAYQLVKAGLAGGKTIPATVTAHPAVFATFTAPSFGPVHTRPTRGNLVLPCQPYRAGRPCPHGRRPGCWQRHTPDDPELGTPICTDCYDYQRAALFNALAGDLWRRTTIALRRELARRMGIPTRNLRRHLRVSYVKVAEYQARGAIHLHAAIRLDGIDPTHSDQPIPPPAGCTTAVLEAAIRAAAARAAVPDPLGGSAYRWGAQLDIRPLHTGGELTAERVAGYVAKYATKATDHLGCGLDQPLSAARLHRLDAPAHIRRLVEACWQLGADPKLAGLRLRKWAHMLGFRGHCTTKSRAYSTTFRALRAARRAWTTIRHQGPTITLDPDGRPIPPAGTVTVAAWSYTGCGYTTPADALLARSLHRQHWEMRRVAREELTAVA